MHGRRALRVAAPPWHARLNRCSIHHCEYVVLCKYHFAVMTAQSVGYAAELRPKVSFRGLTVLSGTHGLTCNECFSQWLPADGVKAGNRPSKPFSDAARQNIRQVGCARERSVRRVTRQPNRFSPRRRVRGRVLFCSWDCRGEFDTGGQTGVFPTLCTKSLGEAVTTFISASPAILNRLKQHIMI